MLTKLEIPNPFRVQSRHMWRKILGQIWPQVEKQTKSGVVTKVCGQIRDQVQRQVWVQVENQVLDELEDQIWNQEVYLSLYFKYV